MKLLFISGSDKFPPFRADVAVLFGRELAGRGHTIDWLLQSEAACDREYEATWSGCRVWVGPTDNRGTTLGKIRRHLLGVRHDARMFGLALRNRYDFIQVKDKFLSALLAILAAKIKIFRFNFRTGYNILQD
jgi:hypothetical protein